MSLPRLQSDRDRCMSFITNEFVTHACVMSQTGRPFELFEC